MFRSVGNNGNDDEGDPFLVDRRMLDKAVDTLDEILGGKIGDNGNDDQKDQGGGSVHAGILDMVQGSITCVGLDGGDTLDFLHAHGQDVGGRQTCQSWFTHGLEAGSRTRSGSGRTSRRGGRISLDDIDEEMVVRVELEEEVCEVNEDEDDRGTTAELEEIGSFETGIDSAVQPFMLSER